ncbi:RNA polymerase sigma factor SigX [Niallia sp. JL1B1071]|uniref:RNA polymerase sigma factor SigX n=1 Tax=Niallia tiangongensis TaxID=3237105 RepID=UPI0037DC61B8
MNGGGEKMNSVFDEIYTKYHHDVFQFLFYMVNHKETAEDLVQEVYIRVLNSYHRFEGKSTEKTWLFSIARNVAIDHFRKQKNWKERIMDKFDWSKQQIKADGFLPEEITLQTEEMKSVYSALQYCTVDQRMVIVFRYIQELSISETAKALGWTESKVKTTQHRALKALRTLLEENGGKEDSYAEKKVE